MVTRYEFWASEDHGEAFLDTEETDLGEWVKYSDYSSLQAALKEALDCWDELETNPAFYERVAELRKQFLDI